MFKYLLKCEKMKDEEFLAESDVEAHKFVEENFEEDDGEMTLYRLTELSTWP